MPVYRDYTLLLSTLKLRIFLFCGVSRVCFPGKDIIVRIIDLDY